MTSANSTFGLPGYEKALPLVAILRGITVYEAVGIAEAIVDAGITLLEVPLNSPDPIDSIAAIAAHCGDKVICGGGTVLTETQVEEISAAGGHLVVSPHFDERVVARALELEMIPVPGVATPTEALAAIRIGARLLKFFPAAGLGAVYLEHIMAVIPPAVAVLAVGGVNGDNMTSFQQAGARGFGIGGDLYRPGYCAKQVAENATSLVAACHQAVRSESF